ncbi:hypothetical protein ONZ43_g3489 [Nemania bipapillata]|uniref:Uncharacterized protein n=1 Tax=Nemania bipapillata TaxID=110536 RepID=A0ACC2IX44_9PEZI|nr:hypothetical protein ONZ43_g3489 [Nemania bipapillata]
MQDRDEYSELWRETRAFGAATPTDMSDITKRPPSNGFDVQLNEPLNHPVFEGYYSYEGHTFEQLTSLEKRVLEMAVHYPHIQDGIMKAPMNFRRDCLTKPQAAQSNVFSKVFGTTELFEKIVGYIIPRYEDLANLSATCQFVAFKIESLWMHFDASNNNFWGWDKEELAAVRRQEADMEAALAESGKGKGREIIRREFYPYLIISPIRPQDQGPTQDVCRSRTRYPVTPSVKKSPETDFGTSMKAHYSLLHFSFLNSHAIKHLILHAMPWVNVATIERIIPEMHGLESLGIYQCFLMNLGDTGPFLKAINAINQKRLKLGEPHIAVDFSPYYYRGSPYKEDGDGHDGEYGVLPEEKCQLGTTRAVTAQLNGLSVLP